MGYAQDNRVPGTKRRLLLQISLTDPNNKRDSVYSADPGPTPVLYLADGLGGPQEFGVISAFGIDYIPMVHNDWEIRSSSGGYGEQQSDADLVFRLANRRYPFQKKRAAAAVAEANFLDVRIDQLFSEYVWHGATVVAYYATLPHYTTTPGLGPAFTGRIYSIGGDGDVYEFRILTPHDYEQMTPNASSPSGGSGPAIVTRKAYPLAPANAIGRVLPSVFCSVPNLDMPFSSEETLLAISPRLLQNLAPMEMISAAYDPAGAGSVGTIVANKHSALSASLYSFVSYIHVAELDTLAALVDGVQTSDTREALFKIAAAPRAQMFLNPNEIYAQTTITQIERAFDGDPTTFASLTAVGSTFQMKIPAVSPLGTIANVKAFAVLAGGIGVAGNCAKFGIYDPSGAPAYYGGGTPAIRTLTKPDVETAGIYFSSAVPQVSIDNTPVRNWQWFSPTGTAAFPLTFKIENLLAGVTTRVIACGFWIEFVPSNLIHNKQHEPAWRNGYDAQGRLRRVFA